MGVDHWHGIPPETCRRNRTGLLPSNCSDRFVAATSTLYNTNVNDDQPAMFGMAFLRASPRTVGENREDPVPRGIVIVRVFNGGL